MLGLPKVMSICIASIHETLIYSRIISLFTVLNNFIRNRTKKALYHTAPSVLVAVPNLRRLSGQYFGKKTISHTGNCWVCDTVFFSSKYRPRCNLMHSMVVTLAQMSLMSLGSGGGRILRFPSVLGVKLTLELLNTLSRIGGE